jgi:hypothetical protein
MIAAGNTVLTGAWVHHYLARFAEQVPTWAARPGRADPFGAWTKTGQPVAISGTITSASFGSTRPFGTPFGRKASPQTHHHVGIHEL